MKIYIDENKLPLLEGAESRNMKLAKHYLYDKCGYDEQKAMQVIGSIKTDIPNVRLAKCKFILGIVRMFIQGELDNAENIMGINKTLKYIASEAHINEYDNNLNGILCDELIKRFEGVAKSDLKQDMDDISQMDIMENNYQIIRIPDFESAKRYKEYTEWCITYNETMYENYTHEGRGLFYFCLKNGFKNIPKEQGENCPLDEYGLSMISVSVNEDGSCNTITCRWNHDNGGNDNIMTPKELSKVIGYKFYEVFKPYTTEELMAKGIIPFHAVPELLAKGKKPKEIFDKIYDCSEGFQTVKLYGKYNIISLDGKLLSPNQWFDSIPWSFKNGFCPIKLNGKWNYLTQYGNILTPNQWYEKTYPFCENGVSGGLILNGAWYKMNDKGILCDYDTEEPIQSSSLSMSEGKIRSKKIYINENKLPLLKESQDEVTFYGFFTQVKNFMKELLNGNVTAEPSQELKKYGLGRKELISKLKKKGLLTSDENIDEVPNEEDETKLRARHTITYSVPKRDFEKKFHRLYSELFESEWKPKRVLSNEKEEIQKILDNDVDGAYKNRGGYKIQEEKSKVGIYYHGGDIKHDIWYNKVLWLTPQDYYAKEYAKNNNTPVIWEVEIDENKLHPCSIFYFDDDFDPYEGPTEEDIENCLNDGINSYWMDYDSYDAEGLCLFNNEPILNIRQLTQEEYNSIEDEIDESKEIKENTNTEISSKFIQDRLANTFERNQDGYMWDGEKYVDIPKDTRIKKYRQVAVDKLSQEKPHSGINTGLYHCDDEKWLDLNKNEEIFFMDNEYQSLEDLYDGVKSGDLLIHCRKMESNIPEDIIYPEVGDTVKDAYGCEMNEEDFEPLIYASDDFTWADMKPDSPYTSSRNGIYFIKSDNFMRYLGDDYIQQPNGEISRYYIPTITIESGDWFSDEPAEAVAVIRKKLPSK